MTIQFSKEESELLVKLLDKRILYLYTINGKSKVRGYSNVRDLLSLEGSWDYSKPQRVKMLSCLNEAKSLDSGKSLEEQLKAISNKLQLSPKDYF